MQHVKTHNLFTVNVKLAVIIIFPTSTDPVDINTDKNFVEGIRLRIMQVSKYYKRV